MNSVRKKKLRVSQKNLDTKLDELSLAEAILKISDLRTEIKELSELKDRERRFSFSEEKEKKTGQLNALQIEQLVEKLEKEKTKLDSAIQSINWKEN